MDELNELIAECEMLSKTLHEIDMEMYENIRKYGYASPEVTKLVLIQTKIKLLQRIARGEGLKDVLRLMDERRI